MAQENSIYVRVYPANQGDGEFECVHEFEDVNYISLVSNETYGIPALITEPRVKSEGLPVKILYINPANVAAFSAVRES